MYKHDKNISITQYNINIYAIYLDRFRRQDEKAKNFTDDVNSCISRQYSKFKFKFTGKSVIIFIIFESLSCKNIYKFLEKKNA